MAHGEIGRTVTIKESKRKVSKGFLKFEDTRLFRELEPGHYQAGGSISCANAAANCIA